MAHEAREAKQAALERKRFEFDWRRAIRWLLHDRLALVMIAFNACLVYYFYSLFTGRSAADALAGALTSDEDEEVVRLRPSSQGRTALHDFLSSVFSSSHHRHEHEKVAEAKQ